MSENVIEWITGDDTISVTLYQKRLVSRVKGLAKKYPDLVTILAENKDGSIFAHLPLKGLKLSIKTFPNLDVEQKRKLHEGYQKWRAEHDLDSST